MAKYSPDAVPLKIEFFVLNPKFASDQLLNASIPFSLTHLLTLVFKDLIFLNSIASVPI